MLFFSSPGTQLRAWTHLRYKAKNIRHSYVAAQFMDVLFNRNQQLSSFVSSCHKKRLVLLSKERNFGIFLEEHVVVASLVHKKANTVYNFANSAENFKKNKSYANQTSNTKLHVQSESVVYS